MYQKWSPLNVDPELFPYGLVLFLKTRILINVAFCILWWWIWLSDWRSPVICWQIPRICQEMSLNITFIQRLLSWWTKDWNVSIMYFKPLYFLLYLCKKNEVTSLVLSVWVRFVRPFNFLIYDLCYFKKLSSILCFLSQKIF